MAQFTNSLKNGGIIGYTSNVLAQRRAAKNALDLQKDTAMAGVNEGINIRAAMAADARSKAAEERASARKRTDTQTLNEMEKAAEERKWGRIKEENAGGFDFASLLREQAPLSVQTSETSDAGTAQPTGGTVTTDAGTYTVDGEVVSPQVTTDTGNIFTIDPATGQVIMTQGG